MEPDILILVGSKVKCVMKELYINVQVVVSE